MTRSLRSALPLMAGYTAFVGVMGSLVAWIEGWPITDGWWWAATTTTTTGYGDLSPATGLGRLLGWLTMLGGIYTIALLVANVVSTRDAWTHEEQKRMFRLLARIIHRLREEEQRHGRS